MPYGLYLSAEGAAAQSKRMEVLANNMANAATVGFKRDQAVFQARLAEATDRGLDAPGSRTINDLGGGVRIAGTVTDFSPGALKTTGGATDAAIDGDAFFVVQKGPQRFLTRAGNFQFDANGMLLTQDGLPVLSDTFTPIVVDPNLPQQMTETGGVYQNGETTLLAMVRPRSLGDLVKVGENLFSSLAPFQSIDLAERNVAPGFLESSGIQPAIEMIELIETSRAFEANTTLIRNQDQLLGSLVTRILKES